MLDVCLIGTSGMVPLKHRWLTAFHAVSEGHAILIDCGEGTQIAMSEASLRLKPIDTICLTHCHADHIAGLPGLLLTMGNQGRTEKVTLIGPPGFSEIVRCLLVIAPLPFDVILCETDGKSGHVFKCGNIEIRPFAVKHVMPCLGYSLILPRGGRFDPEKARALQIPVRCWSLLQKGETVTIDDKVIHPEAVVGPPRKGIHVVYSTDTRPVPEITEAGKNSDLMVLEGIYPGSEKLDKAKEWGHMTFEEAARLAFNAHTKELWLTHFSQSVERPEDFLENAAAVFRNTKIGKDGMKKHFVFED